MSMFGQTTPGGYRFGECVSALQKRIRAGDAREAAYWAVEIEACGAKPRKYLWNRLKVIVSEDIGPTALKATNLVPTGKRPWRRTTTTPGPAATIPTGSS